MNNEEKLQKLIKELQESDGMTPEVVSKAISTLNIIGYTYDHETFPRLRDTVTFSDESKDSPENLAEALLWKLGKWKSYKRFAHHFSNDNSTPSKTNVVFYAFARHLKDPEIPIYDQHAIRAMWAICNRLSEEEKNKCKELLLDGNGNWKATGTGPSAIDCYKIFLKHIGEMVKAGASKRDIDLLLMPLGQALKQTTNNYQKFCQLCGWNDAR